MESSAQRHLTVRTTFREQKAHSKFARHLVADNQTSERRRNNYQGRLRNDGAQRIGQLAAQPLGVLGELQHQRALQILGTVQAAGQPEMAVQICARAAE